jgi:thiamine biosynthesis lipoprotein
MRTHLTALAVAGVLVLPPAQLEPLQPAAPRKKVSRPEAGAGPAVTADRWGEIQVLLVVKKVTTTVGTRKSIKRTIIAGALPASEERRSHTIGINRRVLPVLAQEVLREQFGDRSTSSGGDRYVARLRRVAPGGARQRAPRVTEGPAGLQRVEDIMGMAILVDLRDAIPERAVDEAFDWLRFVDETFSTYKQDSAISRIARSELDPADADPTVREVLDRCEELKEETAGYFDAHAGGSLDPSGLVKGWSVDRAAAMLEEAGARNFAIYAGGDIVVRGGALPEDRWRVGIRHPHVADRVAAVVEANDLAIATSGAYARGDHVLDPHTGRPARGLLSVTITGPVLATADAYATAAFAMGRAAPGWIARLHGYEGMAITSDERVLSTPGFPSVD